MKIVYTLSKLLIFVLGSYGIFESASLQAKEVDALFEVSVPVENQSNSKRRIATRKALVDVMIRISGQSTAVSNAIVKSNLAKASAYIQRYLYREEEIVGNDGVIGKQLMLDLFFDKMELRNLLSDAELPRWGANRPQVLLWIAIGDQKQRFLIGTEAEDMLPLLMSRQPDDEINRLSNEDMVPELEIEQVSIDLKQILTQKAFRRGLPVILPLMDLEDSIAIDVADVWGRFVMPIRQASSRYEHDAILAAQVMKSGDLWQTRWLLLHKGQTLSWAQQSESLEAALVAGVDSTTDQLAEQYAVFEASLQRNEILISVSNIEQIEDYAHLEEYLQNLTSIHSVHVARVSGSTVQLRINLIGEQQAMLQAISLNNRLFRESMPIFSDDSVVAKLPTLFFRWNSEANVQ